MASQARKVFAAFKKRAPGHPGRSASLNSDTSKVQNTLQMLNKNSAETFFGNKRLC